MSLPDRGELMTPDAKLLLQLRERGFINMGDALEICGRCQRRADRALDELEREGVVRQEGSPRRKARWAFVG